MFAEIELIEGTLKFHLWVYLLGCCPTPGRYVRVFLSMIFIEVSNCIASGLFAEMHTNY